MSKRAIDEILAGMSCHFDSPLFPISVVAKAAQIELETARMRVKKHGSALAPFNGAASAQKAGARGSPTLLTFRGVSNFVLASALVSSGIDVVKAHEAAKQWTHFGNKDRDPCYLFDEAAFWTVFVYHPLRSEVLPVSQKSGAIEIVRLFGADKLSASNVVWLDYVVKAADQSCYEYLETKQQIT